MGRTEELCAETVAESCVCEWEIERWSGSVCANRRRGEDDAAEARE